MYSSVLRRRRRADRVTFANIVTEPEDFTAWTAVATPTLTGGQADPFGGTDAFLLADNNGSLQSQVRLAVTFTSDGDKGFSLFMKEGPNPGPAGANFRIEDTTASEVHGVTINWSNGTPDPGGFASVVGLLEYPGGWWRILARAEGITAANSHEFRIIAAPGGGANTGDVFIFGASAHDEAIAGSYER